ncbi:MAG: hypothetical protein ACSLE0_16370 [Chitinophagaceae bacterium]
MKQIITLIAATFFLTALNAGVNTYKDPIKIINEKASMDVTLLSEGRVSIMWNAVKEETSTTVYEIQKKMAGGEFKTIAILMGERLSNYAFRDRVISNSGIIEYSVIASDNNEIVSTLTQKLIVL